MILLTIVFLNGCSTNRDNGKLEFYLATQWNDNSEKLTTYDQLIGVSRLLSTSNRDRFVMEINDEIIYTGYFHQSMLSSFYSVGIVIIDSENGIIISCNKLEADKRSDERVYTVLKDKELLVN